MLKEWFAFVFILCRFTFTYGLPEGAPTKACEPLYPGHYNGSALIECQPDATFPYNLTTSLKEGDALKAGDKVEIKLSSDFQGFLIQARQGDSIIGRFELPKHKNVKTLNCGEGKKNAITHTNPTKKESISATWIAPENYDGNKGSVKFHATVAKTHDIFWVDHVVKL